MSPEHHDKIQALLNQVWHLSKNKTIAQRTAKAHRTLQFLSKFAKDKGFRHVMLTPEQKRMIDMLYGKWEEGKRK